MHDNSLLILSVLVTTPSAQPCDVSPHQKYIEPHHCWQSSTSYLFFKHETVLARVRLRLSVSYSSRTIVLTECLRLDYFDWLRDIMNSIHFAKLYQTEWSHVHACYQKPVRLKTNTWIWIALHQTNLPPAGWSMVYSLSALSKSTQFWPGQ